MAFNEKAKQYILEQEQSALEQKRLAEEKIKLIPKQKEEYWNNVILAGLEQLRNFNVLTLMEEYKQDAWEHTGKISTNPKTVDDIKMDMNNNFISLPEYRLSRKKDYSRHYKKQVGNYEYPPYWPEYEMCHDYITNIDYISIVMNAQQNKIILTSENIPYYEYKPSKPDNHLLTIDITQDSASSEKITKDIEGYFVRQYLVQKEINQDIKNFDKNRTITYKPC